MGRYRELASVLGSIESVGDQLEAKSDIPWDVNLHGGQNLQDPYPRQVVHGQLTLNMERKNVGEGRVCIRGYLRSIPAWHIRMHDVPTQSANIM